MVLPDCAGGHHAALPGRHVVCGEYSPILKPKGHAHAHLTGLSPRRVTMAIGLLMALVFSNIFIWRA